MLPRGSRTGELDGCPPPAAVDLPARPLRSAFRRTSVRVTARRRAHEARRTVRARVVIYRTALYTVVPSRSSESTVKPAQLATTSWLLVGRAPIHVSTEPNPARPGRVTREPYSLSESGESSCNSSRSRCLGTSRSALHHGTSTFEIMFGSGTSVVRTRAYSSTSRRSASSDRTRSDRRDLGSCSTSKSALPGRFKSPGSLRGDRSDSPADWQTSRTESSGSRGITVSPTRLCGTSPEGCPRNAPIAWSILASSRRSRSISFEIWL